MNKKVTIKSIEEASGNLNGTVKNTPLELCQRLSKKYQANIYLKREDLQDVRSFKIRGAYNKISALTDAERKRGVVCASAGNHAQGVAQSCAKLEIMGTIFMPVLTPNQKILRVKSFGGKYIKIKLLGDSYDDASKASKKYCQKYHAVYVHPFDDLTVIAGQGTIAEEIWKKLSGKVDYILVAIGGGGLISGVGSYMKGKNKNIKVIGIESDQQPGMFESIKAGKVVTLKKIDTFVEGTAVKRVGDKTFKIIQRVVDNIHLVKDGHTCTEMIDLFQNEGIITEPAGALSVAGLEKIKRQIKGKNVVCIICGGNNDILRYPEVLEKSLVYRGLKHYFIIEFAQKPGQLKSFLNNALGSDNDIVRFEYIKKTNKEKGPALVGVELKQKENFSRLRKQMDKLGINYKVITEKDILYNYLI